MLKQNRRMAGHWRDFVGGKRKIVKKQNEYEKFSDAFGKILAVPHEEIKRKLEAEKQAKKRKKSKKSSASRAAGDC